MSFLTSNWEWVLLAFYVIEKVVKLSPSKKDDVIFDMVLKPVLDKIKVQKLLEENKFTYIKIISPNFELKYNLSEDETLNRLKKLIRYSNIEKGFT